MMVDVAVNTDGMLKEIKHNRWESHANSMKAQLESQENELRRLTEQLIPLKIQSKVYQNL